MFLLWMRIKILIGKLNRALKRYRGRATLGFLLARGATTFIILDGHTGRYILCHGCGYKSSHADDVYNRYCPSCNFFHQSPTKFTEIV